MLQTKTDNHKYISFSVTSVLIFKLNAKQKEKQIMNTNLDTSKIATLTGKAIQDDETFKSEGGFVPERDQFYFEMKQGDNVFLVGFKDLLISLKLMEQMQEIPKISDKWWSQIATLYGLDLQMLELEDKQ